MFHISKKPNRAILAIWLPIAFVATVLSLFIYAAAQQIYRQSANDPQAQIAEDTSALLAAGTPASVAVPNAKINIANSLAPFVIVYDNAGKVVASTAALDGVTPTVPTGVLDYARDNDMNQLTWQPQNNVRIATVVKHFDGGYVLVGRNLREVENREDQLTAIAAASWLAAIVGSFALILIL